MLAILAVFYSEGLPGFRPFLNLEAMLLVFFGTGACLQIAYPMREVAAAVFHVVLGSPAGDQDEARRWSAILRHAADSAMGVGGVVTILGFILMLNTIDDVSAVPRRMALLLVSLFYGLLLSEAFFMPLARRVRGPDLRLSLPPAGGGGRRRFLVGLGAGGGTVTCFFVVLYTLSASLNADWHKRWSEDRRMDKRVIVVEHGAAGFVQSKPGSAIP